MARHLDLADAVGIDVFFAAPHSPWMRPTNENFNGHLRRYIGKGTDLFVYSQHDLDRISHRINTMPRPIHQWESAADRPSRRATAVSDSPPSIAARISSRSSPSSSTPGMLGPPPVGASG